MHHMLSEIPLNTSARRAESATASPAASATPTTSNSISTEKATTAGAGTNNGSRTQPGISWPSLRGIRNDENYCCASSADQIATCVALKAALGGSVGSGHCAIGCTKELSGTHLAE